VKFDYQTFWRTVTDDGKAPCALYRANCHRCDGLGKFERTTAIGTVVTACLACNSTGIIRCKGGKDAHHYYPKRRIDLKLGGKLSPRAIAAKQDVRNGVCLCRRHHDLVEDGLMESPVPATLSLFCAEHHLEVPAAARENRVLWDRNSLGGPESGPLGDDHEAGGQMRIEPMSEDVAADPD